MSIDLQAVLRRAAELQRATTLSGLLRSTHEASSSLTRYRHAWLAVSGPGDASALRVLQVEGSLQGKVVADFPGLVSELERRRGPVVVLDASTDERTRQTSLVGQRTLVCVPLFGGATLLGVLGVGTSGDEGVLRPTDAELDALGLYAAQLGSALERVTEQDGEVGERRAIERELDSLERLHLVGLLAPGVVHELNNTLAVISSSLGSLAFEALSEEDREAVADSREAARRACEVVAQLQSLGRAGPGRREALDLNARVASTLRLVRSSIPPRVTLRHEAGEAPQVDGDASGIERALANLFLNARDAVAGRGTIDISVGEQHLDASFAREHAWARPGRFARVVVRDSGAGLAPEALDPGLAVVTRVVRQHDGLWCCEARPGEGTTFSLYLPAR